VLSDQGADDPVDRVQNMSFSHDPCATLYFDRFPRQPTGKRSHEDLNYEIHKTPGISKITIQRGIVFSLSNPHGLFN
jgi:hypothetical protein